MSNLYITSSLSVFKGLHRCVFKRVLELSPKARGDRSCVL